MAVFEITEGPPGQGKSLYTMRLFFFLAERNKAWEEKGNPRRKIALNIKLSPEVEEEWKDWIVYWQDSYEITKLRDVDLLWDEIATELDSRNYANLGVEMKRFLSQYRKRGVDIYANTQDFSMIDVRARLMITHVRTLWKIMGSPDISSTKPPPKHIWGVVMIRDMIGFKAMEAEKKEYEIIPSFFWISKKLVEAYDTREDIKLGDPPPLQHRKFICENAHSETDPCTFCKTVHS